MRGIFVFGSNLMGLHYGGAALAAVRQHGAKLKIGFGPTGNAYAIPTVYTPGGAKLPLHVIGKCVEHFLEYAAGHPNNPFLVTALGTGIAGFLHDEIAPLFKDMPVNVLLPRPWHQIVFHKHIPERESFPI